MKNYEEVKHLQALALKEAVESPSGEVIFRAAQNRMVAVSAMSNANAEWVKGMGMLLDYLQQAKERDFR